MNHTVPSPRTIRLHTAALLAAALACCVTGDPAAASTFVIGGDVTRSYAFNPGSPAGTIPLDSFYHTGASSVNDTAHYASSDPQLTRSGQVDARAGFGVVGLSGSTAYATAQPVGGSGYDAMRAFGLATATFTDVLVTGPGSGSVSTRLRLRLRGHLSSTSSPSLETDAIFGSADISFGISINGSTVGWGGLNRSSIDGGSPDISASGLFVGFDGDDVVTTGSFLAPLNTPLTVKLQLQLSLQSQLRYSVHGSASSHAQFYQSLSFATDRPVFDLTAGYSANSPDAGIVNNTYQAPGTNAPVLNINSLSNVVVLTWIATNQAMQLEYSTNILGPWSGVATAPILTNSQFVLTWTNKTDRAFFRLRVP